MYLMDLIVIYFIGGAILMFLLAVIGFKLQERRK